MREGWKRTTLGALAKRLVNGGTPPTEIEAFWNGTTPWITGADFTSRGVEEFRRFVSAAAVRQTSTNVIQQGQLLIVTRTGVGKLAIAPCDIAISQDITGLYVDEAKADPVFLVHRMRTGLQDLKKLNQGTSINGIIRSDLTSYPLELPPLTTQRRIAEILSMLDSAIHQTETLVAKLRDVKSGLMHDLFTRGLASNGTLRAPVGDERHHHFHPTLGWIPKDWSAAPVRSFGSVTLGRQRSPDKHSGLWTTPYLRVANVFDGFIDYSDVLEMDFTPAERNVFSLKFGDILLNEGQSLELVGRSALFEGEADRFCFQNTLVRFRVNAGNSERFFSHLFKWFLDRGVFARIAKQTTSVAHLGADRFARLICIAVPPNEQRAIAERLDESQRLIACEEKRLTKLQQQRQGLMRDLLSGRVSVAEPGV
jgi:type I restriction enzyme S subunit